MHEYMPLCLVHLPLNSSKCLGHLHGDNRNLAMCLIFPRDKDVAVSTLAHPIGNGHLCSIVFCTFVARQEKGQRAMKIICLLESGWWLQMSQVMMLRGLISPNFPFFHIWPIWGLVTRMPWESS